MTVPTATPALRVLAGFASETGPRDDNQDFGAICFAEPGRATGVIAALADGMGGHKGGRVAAETAVRAFIDGYLSRSETLEVRATAGGALEAVNRWLHAQGRSDANLDAMGCTLTAAILRGRRLHVLHVGDTRLYRLRAGQLTQLTRDHRPDGGAHNILTRAVGLEETVRIDYASEPMEAHDRLLLCCDGVHEVLSDTRLAALLAERADPEESARRIIEAATAARTADNASAIVLDILGLPAINMADVGHILAELPMKPPPSAGETIDGFVLTALLADGRYSRVFKARDGDHDVLLKFPKPGVLGAESGARTAFLRESWVASRVESPFVGAIIDLPAGRQTSLYLAQPYYAGETLERRLLRKPPVPLDQGLALAVKLTKAVTALHRAGVIHRDLKPENVILETGGGLKLIDLGVARLPHLDLPAPEIPGTASYMAPELLEGGEADERTDVFALGVTLYRMFSGGRYPYGEIEPFSRPKFRKPTPLAAFRPDLPAWLGALLERAVAADPRERVQDAVELTFEIEAGAGAGGGRPVFRPTNLYDRDPLRFWQIACLILAGLLLVSLAH